MRQLPVYVQNPAVSDSFRDFFNLFILFCSLALLHWGKYSNSAVHNRLCTFLVEASVSGNSNQRALLTNLIPYDSKQNHIRQLSSVLFLFVSSLSYIQVKFLGKYVRYNGCSL